MSSWNWAELIVGGVLGVVLTKAADWGWASTLKVVRGNLFELRSLRRAFDEVRDSDEEFGLVCRTISEIYADDHQLLEIAGQSYPCVLFASENEDVEASVNCKVDGWRTNYVAPSNTYRRMVDHAYRGGNQLYNGDLALLRSIRQSAAGPVLDCSMTENSFFDCLDTCQSLEFELVLAARRRTILGALREPEQVRKNLRLRNRVHSAVADPVVVGEHRAVGVGGSTVILFKRREAWFVLLPMRTKDGVAGQSGSRAVAPTYYMQSKGLDRIELTVRHNVIREYYEELMGGSEDTNHPPRWIYSQDSVSKLTRLMDETPHRARIANLGIAVDLLNLRPDVCTLLVIDDEPWWDSLTTGGAEFEGGNDWARSAVRFDALLKFFDGNDDEFFTPRTIAPASAGALKLALEKIGRDPDEFLTAGS